MLNRPSKTLTISIAAYNMERLLPRALDSLVESNYLSDLDIIIVNDGSTDSTAHIGQSYEQRYPSSIRLLDKENGNYGSTINASLKIARGKYYRLLDADDWYNTKSLDSLVSFLKNTTVDLVITPYVQHNEQTDEQTRFSLPDWANIGKELLYDQCPFNPERFYPPMHMSTFKTALLRDNNITITEGSAYTDFEFIIKPIPFIEQIAFLDEPVYQYRWGASDQSVSISSWQRNIEKGMGITLGMVDYYNHLDLAHLPPMKRNVLLYEISSSVAEKFTYLLSFKPNRKTRFVMKNFEKTVHEKSDVIWERCITTSNFPTKLYLQHPGLYHLSSWMIRTYYHSKGML